MCNIAGYIGNDSAAEILLKMMEKQEGFGGGYYSGIATLHEGKIYHAKVVGNFETLRKETDAANFPGSVGIAHSRPKLGGGIEWAHPFVNDSESIAYLANGHPGFFADAENEKKIISKLLQHGQEFRSASTELRTEHSLYPELPDGRVLHSTEVMCHLISLYNEQEKNSLEAMRKAFVDYPAEIVGLSIFSEVPDKIIASRFNQPLMIGYSIDAVFMASTALAFPEDSGIDTINPMPVSSSAVISKDSMEIYPFIPDRGKVANTFPFAYACEKILKELSEDAKTLQNLKNATAPLWPEDSAPQKDMLVYEILRSLYSQGKISFKDFTVEGLNGTQASQKKICLRSF
jgi:glucosamine--fructose-6-phosphate aminotransferase (isomerizing)